MAEAAAITAGATIAASAGIGEIMRKFFEIITRRRITLRRHRCLPIDCTSGNAGLHIKELLKSIAEHMDKKPDLWRAYMPGWASIFGFTHVSGDKTVPIKVDSPPRTSKLRAAS